MRVILAHASACLALNAVLRAFRHRLMKEKIRGNETLEERMQVFSAGLAMEHLPISYLLE